MKKLLAFTGIFAAMMTASVPAHAVDAPKPVEEVVQPSSPPVMEAMAEGCGFSFWGQRYNHCGDGHVQLAIAWTAAGNNGWGGGTDWVCVGPGWTNSLGLIGPFNIMTYMDYTGKTC